MKSGLPFKPSNPVGTLVSWVRSGLAGLGAGLSARRKVLEIKNAGGVQVSGFTEAGLLFSTTPTLPLKRQTSLDALLPKLAERWLVYPALQEEFPLPKTTEEGDAARFSQFLRVSHPATYDYRFPNAIHLSKHGAVANAAHEVYEDLIDSTPGRFPKDRVWINPFVRPGDSFVLSGSSNHYHWLVKMLPRMHLLEQIDRPLSSFDTLLISKPLPAHMEGYALAGIPTRKLRIVEGDKFAFCQNLYTTPIPQNDPAWALEYLRRRFSPLLSQRVNFPRAVYFSRGSEARKRRVVNHEEVAAFFQSIGVAVCELAKLSFAEQVALAANADLIIAPHGAGLANLAFAKEGARVLEIFANPSNQKCFWRIANQRKLIYHYMMAEVVPAGDHANHFDLRIPLEKLKRAVDFLLADNG